MKKSALFLLAVIIFSGTICVAQEEKNLEPLQFIQKKTELIREIINKPCENESKSLEIKRNVFNIFFNSFDSKSFAAYVFNTQGLNQRQLDEAENFLKIVVANFYYTKIKGNTDNKDQVEIKYLKTVFSNDKKMAFVQVEYIKNGIPTEVIYTLNCDNLRIHDVKIEGVSLRVNYQQQFRGRTFKNKKGEEFLVELRKLMKEKKINI